MEQQTWHSPRLTARRSSDTWNEPYAAPAATQREPDHTSHAPPNFSSPPPHVNEDLLRRNTSVGVANYHDALRHPPREPFTNTSYHGPPRDIPTPNAFQPATPRSSIPHASHSNGNISHTAAQQSIPQQQTHNQTPQQPFAYEINHQAIESDSDDDDTMPRHRAVVNDSPVDLTQSPTIPTASASQQLRTRKRSSTSNRADEGSANKRTKRTSISTARVDVEDLQDEAPSAEDELLQAQQQEALKMQETKKDDEAVKIGQRTCIICLENYTNATTAICGSSNPNIIHAS
jgi:hypothetical protein